MLEIGQLDSIRTLAERASLPTAAVQANEPRLISVGEGISGKKVRIPQKG